MKDDIRERVIELLVGILLAFVLSSLMRAVADQFHVTTPGQLFLNWYVPGSSHFLLGGPALLYELLVDLVFCFVILLVLYRVVQKRFYDA